SGLISTIVFRVISPGTTSISVSDAAVYLNDGQGTDILNSVGRGIYDLTLPPPEGPQIFSSTHPDQNKWYKNNNPTLNWEREGGVTGFSHSMDKDFQGVPDNISEGLENAVSYDNLGDGIWYFHVKAEKGNIWGGISHYVLNIDTTPPAEFSLEIEANLNMAAIVLVKQPIVSFVTTDALSGMDHYEIKTIPFKEDSGKALTVLTEGQENDFFVETISPYKLPINNGLYQVMVRAYDKAGNWRDSSQVVRFIPEGKFTVNLDGVNFWIIFIYWWVIAIIIGVPLIAILIIIFLRKRIRKPQETKDPK
ncbi:MAG: hypothetical protein Q8N59_03490, partial [bacterium]|nr:hypothetical protein [bacterium]